MDYKINNLKNILHGFFLALALAIAEPSTTLPLIVHHFSDSEIIVGLFTSLLRGGAIVVQLAAAFWAQSYPLMMPYLRRVFLTRFLSWLAIGVAILLFGERYPTLTLSLIGVGLFLFSFSAGFGSIYFHEILAKIFPHELRGKAMANRQFFAALGSILSGLVAGWILSHFTPPQSYGYLFIVSAFLMSVGLIAFASIKEPPKKKVNQKEKKFRHFLKNAFSLLKNDPRLQLQIAVVFLSYSYLLSFSFVILQAQQCLDLSGWLVGGFITIQMGGALLGNLLYKKLSPHYKRIFQLGFLFTILAFTLLLLSHHTTTFFTAFFLLGMGIDGFRLAMMNLLFAIAPEEKRPIYIALQNNLTSIGLFFAIPGGFILHHFGFETLYILTITLLSIGLTLSLKIDDQNPPPSHTHQTRSTTSAA